MNTPSKAYVTKLSSGTILALLAFSSLLLLIPVASPIFAANASLPGVSVSGNNPALGTDSATFTLTVSNPASNQFTVTAFTINAPSGWTITAALPGGFLSGAPSFTASGVTWTVSTFFVGTGAGIPPGSSDTLKFTATAPSGTYPFSNTFTSKVQDASAVAFYTGPSFSILVISPATVITVVTPALATNYVAGSAALSETATITPPQAGVPIVFTETGYTGAGFTAYSFTPATALTNSGGVATTVFQPSNLDCTTDPLDCSTPITASVGTSIVAPLSSAAITTLAGAPTKIAWTFASSNPTNGNHYITTEATTKNQGGVVAAVTGAMMGAAGASFSISDKFGNAVAFNAPSLTTWTVTLTALSGGGVFDATGLPAVISCTMGNANWEVGTTPLLIPANACPVAGTSATLPFDYYQSAVYNSIGELSAGVSGKFAGSAFAGAGDSGLLITSTFATGLSPTPVVVLTSAETAAGVVLPNVPAGDQVNVTATLPVPSTCGAGGATACPPQPGVPVQLMLDIFTSFESAGPPLVAYGANSKLTVGFSNGLTYNTFTTNSNGLASGLFTIDTVATPTQSTAFFMDNVTAPTDVSLTADLANSTDSANVLTIANTPATFTVLTYYDSGLTTSATHAATGATLYVDVTISDKYGNVAVNSAITAIQINLAATAGTLSATVVYIKSAASDTASSFGPITWTMPSSIGSASLTATGVLSGKSITSAPNTIGVVSPLPTLAILAPTPLSGVIYSSVNSVVFSGQANVSIGYASAGPQAVKITSITYSIDGGAVQTAPITTGYTITFSVAATMTAGLHSVVFNATDSLGNVATSSKYSVLVDTTAPTVAFVTKTGATINFTNAVTATITVPEGDLNATSVTASLNGTALASSHVTVTGSNNLGHSVTYTVTISGLAAGDDTVGLSATSLAGLTGTAATIIVTVEVAYPTSELITSATYCTIGSFSGICVSDTNTWTTSQNLVVFAVWKNSGGQTAAVTTGGLTLAAGASGSAFAPLAGALPSGTYTVSVFVITTSSAPVSSTTTITASQ